MKPTLSMTVVLLVSTFVHVPNAWGHGGVYLGPVTTPPATAPNPSAPAGSRGGSTSGGTALPRRGMTSGPDVRLWETWWAFNKEDFFPARGLTGFRARPDSGYDLTERRPPTAKEVRARIIPALINLIQNEKHPEIRNSATLALGKVGDVREFALLSSLTSDGERTVRESAILGLGLLIEERAEKFLAELAMDASRSALERGFAVMALGLSGGELAKNLLATNFGMPQSGGLGSRSRAAQLETVRALALGLCGGADIAPPGAAPAPTSATGHMIQAIRKDLVPEQTFLPTCLAALAKTRDAAAQEVVLQGLFHRKAEVRGGAAVAVGRVYQNPGKKTVARLVQILRDEGDLFPRRVLLISLGRMGGPDASAALKAELSNKDRQHRAFAALGLAILGAKEMIPQFRKELQAARDISSKGAYAIALGLLNDAGGDQVILEEIATNKSPELLSHLVQALILLRKVESAPAIEKVLANTRSADLQASGALALGLIGSQGSTELLLSLLKESGTITVKGAAATGLGRMGDSSLIEPLVAFVNNAKEQDLSRAFGAIALGILGEKLPTLPPFARISIDSHYDLRVTTLDQLRDLL